MTSHAQKTPSARKAILRRRAAILAAGMGASLALGTGVAAATAHDSAPQSHQASAAASHATFGSSNGGALAQTVNAQADSQHKAAVAKAADAAKADAAKRAAAAKAEAAKADAAKRAAAKAAADRKEQAAKKITPASWVKPVDHYKLGATFGLGGSHWSHKHSGQDFEVPIGTTVKSAHKGTVVDAGWGGAYGNNIVVKHGPHTYTQYGHLSKIEAQQGQTVNAGQEIGKSGNTGNTTGPHLHFETRTEPVYGFAVEPVKFMHDHGVDL